MQLREAFPWDTAPRYLLRDRDRIFGKPFVDQIKSMGIKQVLWAPRSPWQRACVERVIGSIRRECLDHVIVFGEGSLSRHLQSFVDYYRRSRTHLGLEKDSPVPRPIQSADMGRVVSMREVEVSSARFHPHCCVPLRRLIDGPRGRETFCEAARGVASRRHRASEVRRRPLKNQKGCAIRPVTRQEEEVSENDKLSLDGTSHV